MRAKTLQLFKDNTDLEVIENHWVVDCGDTTLAIMTVVSVLAWLALLIVILVSGPILTVPLLGSLALLIAAGVIGFLISCGTACAAETVAEHRFPQLERRVHQKIAWRPRVGSDFAPMGTHAQMVIERGPDNLSPNLLSAGLCIWHMTDQGWQRQGWAIGPKSFADHQDHELDVFEAEMREHAQQMNQQSLNAQSEAEAQHQQAQSFVSQRTGYEIVA